MPTQTFIDVSLNPESFEQLISSQGIRMIHSRPVPCPFVRDLHNLDHDPACNECFNGFLYYNPVEFVGAFMGNSLDRKFNMNGTWDQDQVSIVTPVHDKNGGIVDVQYFDQIILPDAPLVRYYHRVEHSQSGIDRLHFPAVVVDFLKDNTGKIYRPDVDFVLNKGRIHWIGERPGWDPVLERGVIYSVNYYTRPQLTVVSLPHHLRLGQTQSEPGKPNKMARFPQLAICRKDFIPFDSADHTGAPDTPEPRDGSF